MDGESGARDAEAQRVLAASVNDPNSGATPNTPYIRTNTNGNYQVFGGFDLSPSLSGGEIVTGIRGLQVFLDDA